MITIPGKIPIRISPVFWILAIFIGWINSETILGTAIWSIIIFISVLIHEYGHALTALAFGQRAHIEFVALGGVTHRSGDKKLKLWQEFLIVLNGPLAGLLLCFAAYAVQQYMGFTKITTPLEYAIQITVLANLFWTIINLLPIFPLDGGHLLRIIMESIFGIKGVKLTFLISSILGLVGSLFFFMDRAFLAGSLFLLLAYESYRTWKSSLVMTEYDQDDDLQKVLKLAEESLHKGDIENAKNALEQVRSATGSGIIYISATEDLAEALRTQGKFQEVYNILFPLSSKLSPMALNLLHEAAYKTGDFQEAAAIGDRLYQIDPGYDTALINSLSYAQLEEVKPAIGWLQRAINDGLPNASVILRKEEFDKIKSDPLFMELKKHYL
jgi:stage IV sporulation protein FB